MSVAPRCSMRWEKRTSIEPDDEPRTFGDVLCLCEQEEEVGVGHRVLLLYRAPPGRIEGVTRREMPREESQVQLGRLSRERWDVEVGCGRWCGRGKGCLSGRTVGNANATAAAREWRGRRGG